MLSLRAVPSTSANPIGRERYMPLAQRKCALRIRASGGAGKEAIQMEGDSLAGVLFKPFTEVKEQLMKIPDSSSASFARHRFAPACESAINDQINVEYNVSYVYHAMFAYFDRDNVGLPGIAKFFKKSSEEEREHAEKLMKYQASVPVGSISDSYLSLIVFFFGSPTQNKRGGKVMLNNILAPSVTEFDHDEKGDALYAMELSLALEKLTNDKLLALHQVAQDNNDPQMTDFIESEFLEEQVDSIKQFSVYVSQLRRVGKGHGVYHFDRTFLD